jgi:glycine oxidase
VSDIAVAGGGLIGLAIAWRSAQRGISVTVVDPAAGSGASYAAAGMLAPVTEVAYGERPLLELCRASLARYPAFVAEVQHVSGIDVGLRTAGTLLVGFDADDMRVLDELHAFQRELGLTAERLTASQARRRESALTPRLRGALHVQDDHSIDARALHAALLAAAEATGVQVVRSLVDGLRIESGRVTGLLVHGGGELAADTVVLALGAWSGSLPGVPPLPVRPVKGQILRLGAAAGLLDGSVRALVRGRQVYLVPHGSDRLVVGATVEEKGFDAAVTAGAVHDLLHDAIEVVPGIAELELIESLARWRPGTLDNAPLLGPSTVPGLVLATGHYRNGVLLTPVTGEVIAELLASGTLPALAAAFVPDRFGR